MAIGHYVKSRAAANRGNILDIIPISGYHAYSSVPPPWYANNVHKSAAYTLILLVS